jgi:hypothetical protein
MSDIEHNVAKFCCGGAVVIALIAAVSGVWWAMICALIGAGLCAYAASPDSEIEERPNETD